VIETWDEYKIFENKLRSFVKSVRAIPKIKKALSYVISSGGKRTRPLIVLLSGKMCGGEYSKLMNLALSVELIHTASLIHDDVIDGAEKRRRQSSLHKKYDISLAIVLGDWLISKSVELTSKYGREIIREYSKVGMMMSEGEIIDTYSTKSMFTEKDYFECIKKKTASLFAYSAKTACKIVCDDLKAATKLFKYGLNLGIAYQLVDDLLEYTRVVKDKKSIFESKTLPQIYEEKFGKDEVKRRIIDLIDRYLNKCIGALEYFDECDEKRKLRKIAEYMTYTMINRHLKSSFSKFSEEF